MAWYAAWGVPLATGLTSLALGLLIYLSPSAEKRHASRTLIWDLAVSLPALLANLAIMIAWSRLADGFIAWGLLATSLVCAKALVLLPLLAKVFFPAPEPHGSLPQWRRSAAVFVVFAGLVAALAPWVNQAISTASDEVGYLLRAHSLVEHHTTDVTAAAKAKEYREFYWARWSDRLAHQGRDIRSALYPLVLAPAYALGGRLGVLFLGALLFGLIAAQLVRWLIESKVPPRMAGLAVALTLTTAPILFMSQLAFPDLPGMLLFLLSLRLLGRVHAKPLWASLGVLAMAALLYLVKTRLGILGVGLLISLAWEWTRPRLSKGPALALVLAGLLGCTLVFAMWIYPILIVPWQLAPWWQPIWAFVSGLSMDRNFGVIFTAPVLVLALAGLPNALRRFNRPAMHALIPMALYVVILGYGNWSAWHGGFATPARYLAVVLPACALFMVPCLQALAAPFKRLVYWSLAVLGSVFTIGGMIMPHLRYTSPGELNRVAAKTEELTGLGFHHILPSAFGNSSAIAWWFAGMLAVAGLLAWYTAKSTPSGQDLPTAKWRPKEIAALAGALLAVLFVVAVAAKLLPPRILETERMAAPVQRIWSPNNPLYLRGRVLHTSETISGALRFPGGKARLELVGLARAKGEAQITIDGKPAAAAIFKPDPRFERKFRIGERTRGYFGGARTVVIVDLEDVDQGAHVIGITWRSCGQRECWLLLDYIKRLDAKR